jgi:hypothetical protein
MAVERPQADTADTLMKDILAESKNTAGTWSLASHNRLIAFVATAKPDDIALFTRQIVQNLTDGERGATERFKLAQLCTTVRRACPRLASIFMEFKEELLGVASRSQDPLDTATAKLLGSLFDPIAPKAAIPHPSAGPVCRTKFIAPKRPMKSATPPPR